MTAVADAGPVIALAKLDHLALLPVLYDQVLLPSQVHDEVIVRGQAGGHADADAVRAAIAGGGLRLLNTAEEALPAAVRALPLGLGELHAIHAAIRYRVDWLLVDDAEARLAAARLNLRVKGTLGVIVDASRSDVLTTAERDAIFATLIARQDIWLDEELVRRVWDALREGS